MQKLFASSEVVTIAILCGVFSAVITGITTIENYSLANDLLSVGTLSLALIGGAVSLMIASLATSLDDFGVYVE
jgi:hypothetical protein